MANTPDEAKLKELLKSAVVEVLEERRDLVRKAVTEAIEDMGIVSTRGSQPLNRTVKAIVFCIVLLLTAILLYQVVQHTT
jgi:hypothetical protein